MIRSDNYDQVCAHYKGLLSKHYTWTFGGPDTKYLVNMNLFKQYLPTGWSRVALDLGCGSGFQTIPLLKLDYTVYAIDLSSALLEEVVSEQKRTKLSECTLNTIQGDILSFPTLCNTKFDVITCMGDTLTHLANLAEVCQLLGQIFDNLNDQGILCLQYSDLTKPLNGTDRFIPIQSDERTVFTCFLEWESDTKLDGDGSGCIVRVHDLVHVKKGVGAWELCKSWYRKLGLTKNYIVQELQKIGFSIVDCLDENGMIVIICRK